MARRPASLRALVGRWRAGSASSAAGYMPPTEHLAGATPEDIFYCFRLLLGRCPNPEEWPGHSSRAGEDLANVVGSYLTSREFALRRLTRGSSPDNIELVGLPGFSLYASRDDLAVGRHVIADYCYETHVAAALERYAKPGIAAVDIGANIGYMTMLLAARVGPAGRVFAVEPNPDNARLLEASRRANGFDQVVVIAAAAGRETGLLALNVSHSNGMTGDLPGDPAALFDGRVVPCFALDAILPQDRPIGLVKLDAEGAEMNALIGLAETIARDRPVIVSEFSPGMLPGISHCNGGDYLRHLIACGYRLAVIEAGGSERTFGADVAGVMAVYQASGVDHIDIVATPK